jgi:ATP-dependent RNA helicase RhlB
MKLLLGILEQENPESAIVFCFFKCYAEIVARRLRINGIECVFIIGDLPQAKRLKIIDDIKAGRIRILVATDVAARGLDIEDLSLVVNYDLPVESENYVHRIGRTARAGRTGKAVTLASEQDVYELPDIEKYIGKKIPSQIADESLYKGDKSEGVRIKTDFYDDRKKGVREKSSPQRRGAGKGRSGRSRDGRRGLSREDKYGGLPEKRDRPNEFDQPNLAGLSFEERMAYYKEKYEGGRKGADKNKDKARSTGRTKINKSTPANGEKQKVSGRNKRGSGRHADENSGVQTARNSKAAGNVKAENVRAGDVPVYSQSPQPKKGILGKLLGVLRKK